MKSKTIIISSQEEKGRGILTIYQEEDLLKCKLRLYNSKKLNRFCKLGIYHQNQVFSANLLEKSGTYLSSMVGDFDINQDFYSAIIDTSENNKVLFSGGTYAGYFFNDQSVFENIEKENPNTNIYNYDEDSISQDCSCTSLNMTAKTEKDATTKECDKCVNCKYKEFFYSQQNACSSEYDKTESMNLEKRTQLSGLKDPSTTLRSAQDDMKKRSAQDDTKDSSTGLPEKQTKRFEWESEQSLENEVCEPSEQTIKDSELRAQTSLTNSDPCNSKAKFDCSSDLANALSEEQQTSILSSLISQFQYVFENYQADEILNALIPNGRFVQIDENQNKYSIGAIYEEEKMKYICYAVQRDYNSPAPEELGENYQWLPLDKEDPLSEGYYIVFQDANDLKIVEM